MTSMRRVTPTQVVRASALPTLFLFVIPLFALWFAGYAARSADESFLGYIEEQLHRDAQMTPDQRGAASTFYREHPPSRVCAGEGGADGPELRAQLGDICDDHAQFRIAGQASAAAIGLGLLAVIIAMLGALTAHLSRAAEYRSFVTSFHLLRLVTALITIVQAGLVVWLSYWVTAIWFEVYYVKLVLIAALLAAFVVFAIVRAIFAKLPRTIPINGLLVPKEKAAAIFARLEVICSELGTHPPDHLVAGIDDNFFVCEGEVSCSNGDASGRVLYVSLSLLRILSKREAEAVLVHEMAHFSGGDVEHTTKLAPALARFGLYVHSLNESPLSIPVARFLLAFGSLFELSFGRSHRERELVADSTAARLISPEDMARALVRIGAYASFGARVEAALFEKDEVHESLSIAERIDNGFSDYLRTPKVAFDLVASTIPHPFDSHPPLIDRLANVGIVIADSELVRLIEATSDERHYESIEGADALEATQWTLYEASFRENHEIALAHRYEPANPRERAVVEKHFPTQSIPGKDGAPYVTMDCLELSCRDWPAPIAWTEIKTAEFDDRWTKKPLEITRVSDGVLTKKLSIKTYELPQGADGFLPEFNRYWTRSRAAAAYRKELGNA